MKTLILTLALVQINIASAYNEVANGDEIRERVGTTELTHRDLSKVRVAVLDNGFRGFQVKKGMLPDSAELIEGPLKLPETSAHGLGMAQILWEATGKNPLGPKIYLLNSNGFTNFKAAVDFVIRNKIDVVLYSQIWTFGSNFDGKGFINEVVNRAVNAGVVWINAAGNLGGQVYNGKVEGAEKIELGNKLDDNSFTLTLTWNDFAESESLCTSKDLDLEITNEQGELVHSGVLVQSGVSPDPKDPQDKRTCYAREIVAAKDLARGKYFITVKKKSQNFGARDEFRLIITENKLGSLEFVGGATGLEIMPPADNANVFTVGEKSPFSAMGPTATGRVKPDVVVENAQVSFTNGNQTAGSSNAAAMVAGAVVHLKGAIPEFTGKQLIEYGESLRGRAVIPAGLVKLANVPEWVRRLIPNGGVVRQDPGTYRLVILSHKVPTMLPELRLFNLQMGRPTDLVACHESMRQCQVFPVEQDLNIRPPYIEFRQYKNAGSSDRPGLWVMPNP